MSTVKNLDATSSFNTLEKAKSSIQHALSHVNEFVKQNPALSVLTATAGAAIGIYAIHKKKQNHKSHLIELIDEEVIYTIQKLIYPLSLSKLV